MATGKTPARTVHLATLDTRHFSFKAVGDDREEARQAIYRAWQAHYEQTPDRHPDMPRTLEELEAKFDINYERLRLGQGYRDGEALPRD